VFDVQCMEGLVVADELQNYILMIDGHPPPNTKDSLSSSQKRLTRGGGMASAIYVSETLLVSHRSTLARQRLETSRHSCHHVIRSLFPLLPLSQRALRSPQSPPCPFSSPYIYIPLVCTRFPLSGCPNSTPLTVRRNVVRRRIVRLRQPKTQVPRQSRAPLGRRQWSQLPRL